MSVAAECRRAWSPAHSVKSWYRRVKFLGSTGVPMLDAVEIALACSAWFSGRYQGELPAYRFGRVIRFKRTDIDAFMEHSRIEPGTLDHLSPDSGSGRSNGDEDDE